MFKFHIANPIPLVDAAGWDTGTEEQQKRWHQYRNHAAESEDDPHWTDYSITGSAMSALFDAGFKSKISLYFEKKGTYKPAPPSAETQWIFDFGHFAEEVSAQLFAKKTGYTVFNDTVMYQHGAYKWAVADMDRRYVRPDGEEGILECKTTSFANREKWQDGWPKGYEIQLRFYMAIANVKHGALCCFWGNGANDFAYYEFERDLELEEELFATAYSFIDDLRNNREPNPEEVMGGSAAEELKSIFAVSDPTLGKMEIPAEYESAIRAYSTYSEQISSLNAQVKDLTAKRDSLVAPLLLHLKNTPAAFLETKEEIFDISYKSNSPTEKVSFKEVAKNDKALAEELRNKGFVTSSAARPFKVKVIKK